MPASCAPRPLAPQTLATCTDGHTTGVFKQSRDNDKEDVAQTLQASPLRCRHVDLMIWFVVYNNFTDKPIKILLLPPAL